MSEPPVRPERTGWRDGRISLRHREWGFNCPAADLDFFVVEYNLGLPVGLIEYKHYLARRPDTRHPTYRAMRDLADGYRDGLPFLIAFYWPDIWAFRVYPVNDKAREWFAMGELLTERQYVSRLYDMRALVVSAEVISALCDDLPIEEVA